MGEWINDCESCNKFIMPHFNVWNGIMITNVCMLCMCVMMCEWFDETYRGISMRIHNGAMRWSMGQRIDEWIFKRNWNDECHDYDGWRCDINDNDLWTISWFTTNKQVAVHIMTTFVRILAYSDATLFDMLETVSLKILGRFFAPNPSHTRLFSSRVENYHGLEFSAKPFAKRSHYWNLYDR